MKTIFYFVMAIICLACAVCSIVILATHPITGAQIFGYLFMAVLSMAMTMIFGYAFYWHVKENRLIDLAAKEQLERDWSNYIYD
jgi:hypothetical protein